MQRNGTLESFVSVLAGRFEAEVSRGDQANPGPATPRKRRRLAWGRESKNCHRAIMIMGCEPTSTASDDDNDDEDDGDDDDDVGSRWLIRWVAV